MSYRIKGIRLLPLEDSIIDRACAALNGMERSMLMQEGVMAEANRLGIRWSVQRPPPLTVPWPYMPEHGGEPTAVRIGMSMSIPLAELVTRGAQHVNASEPQFIVGSTLAYVGRLQRCFEALHAETPEEGKRMLRDLQRIKLPAQYQYPPRRNRALNQTRPRD
jgi:hypothetical protein